MTTKTEMVDNSMLKARVKAVAEQHGSLNRAARALEIDKAYLSRLLTGEKTNPSTKVLRKLRLTRYVTFLGPREEAA